MNNEKDEASVLASFPAEAQLTSVWQPKPVGAWVLYPGTLMKTKLCMYKRPTDEQIKNTEHLLGWGWEEMT